MNVKLTERSVAIVISYYPDNIILLQRISSQPTLTNVCLVFFVFSVCSSLLFFYCCVILLLGQLEEFVSFRCNRQSSGRDSTGDENRETCGTDV